MTPETVVNSPMTAPPANIPALMAYPHDVAVAAGNGFGFATAW